MVQKQNKHTMIM